MSQLRPPCLSCWVTLSIAMAAFALALAGFSIALVVLMGGHHG